jgi:CheY-like chemotaxis protein
MNSIGPEQSHGKVLVVDDDEPILTLLSDILKAAGYEVSTAQDGGKALRIAQIQSFDLLLTDLVMPDRDGIEVIQSIRKHQPNLKIIAISGAFGGGMLRAAELLGAHATLPKPCNSNHLLTTVHKVLQSSA